MKTWTDPHHGVSHLLNPPEGFQYTVTDYGSLSVAHEIPLNDHPFTKGREEVFYQTHQAMQWCERASAARK